MRVGELRKRVTFQSETSSSDNAGGYTLGWTTVATVWAAIEPLNGREVFTAQHLEGHVTHRVIIRYRSDITSDMRMVYGARVFNVRAVINQDERNCWTTLLVEEGVAA